MDITLFYLGLKGRSWPRGETRLPVDEEEAEVIAKGAELMQDDVEIKEVANGLEEVGEEVVGSEAVDVYSEPTVWKQRYSLTFEKG